MNDSDSNPMPSIDDVARVATLSRLALDEAGLEAARRDLSAILGHVAAIQSLDVDDVEPMPRPPSTRSVRSCSTSIGKSGTPLRHCSSESSRWVVTAERPVWASMTGLVISRWP